MMEYEIGKEHKFPQRLSGFGVPAPNPLLDKLLPALLLINLCSLLEEALSEYAGENSIAIPPKKENLNGKIEVFSGLNLLKDRSSLDKVRRDRNSHAHEFTNTMDWKKFEEYRKIVEGELLNLKVLDQTPEYEMFGEREQLKASSDPMALGEQEYKFGLKNKRNGAIVYEIKWTEKLMK